MAAFVNLEDSPMFRKQIHSLEETTDVLKDRCQKLHQGCKRFMTSLGEAYNGDISFADALEAFGAGQDDPDSVAIGGPVMSKFITAFRELATYKELLRSQVEHMLADRLTQFISEDLQNVKECRKRLDKATAGYDQARDKFMSIKKGTRADIVTKLEEDLHNSKSTFDRCRFNLVNALANVEAKKKFEFLESISAVMDAHLRYYKQGHELLSQMEPFIHEVLTYAQQSKEMANTEQDKLATRIQEFRTQSQISNLNSTGNVDAASNGDGIHVVGVNSYKSIEALMQSTAGGEVQVIKQGYLLKRSPKARGDWRRRFFVLDSHGTLYYYRSTWNKQPQGPLAQNLTGTSGGAVGFGRFRFSQKRALSQGDDNLWFRTVNLLTSTIKMDEEQTDLRFCFRIISPVKTLTLQAENEMERMEWVDKITGVIASLLNSPFPKQLSSGDMHVENDSSSKQSGSDVLTGEENTSAAGHGNVSVILRRVPGNDICAECGSPEPEWASLNLGILICIECSGVHRNLGVHISKVRSLTLDVKVWESSVVDLLCALGNSYCNSVWEGLLPHQGESIGDPKPDQSSFEKPVPKDPLSRKEKYIYAKYVNKALVVRETNQDLPPVAVRIWGAVGANNVQLVYHLLVASDASANTRYNDVSSELHHEETTSKRNQLDPANCLRISSSGQPDSCLQGCSLLHFGCHIGDPIMLELLLQFGADINLQDFHGRTPLHHCIFLKNYSLAKFLIRRGARTSIKDGGGLTALERTMELGAITDEELLVLLVEHQ